MPLGGYRGAGSDATWCSKTFVQKTIRENRMAVNSYLDFNVTETWPLNSPEINPLDHHVWGNARALSQAP